MYELSLFPLNTVLFPGTPLQLHIFEERYKLMIGSCIDNRLPFGVVLIRHGQEALGPLAEPHDVGCWARIIHVQRLSEGRMNIISVGERRFRIHSIDSKTLPYLIGIVEDLPLQILETEVVEKSARLLRNQVTTLIQALARTGSTQFDPTQLPGDAISLAYVAAALLQVPQELKQHFLEIDQADTLLTSLNLAYRRENALLKAFLTDQDSLLDGGFSKN